MGPNQERDRREHPREPATHAASILLDKGPAVSVTIENFCPGGLFLRTKQADSLAVGQTLNVAIDGFDAPAVGRVVRIEAGGVGLAFRKTQTQLTEYLREAGNSPRQKRTAGISSRKRKEVLKDIRESSLEFLDDRLPRFMEDAREQLIEEADKAGSNVGQGIYFEAFTVLKKNAGKLIDSLRGAVSRHLDSFEDLQFSVPGSAEGDGGELALVDESEFEIWLAESESASAANSRFHNDLHALEARLSIVTDQRVDSRNNPLGPKALAHHAVEVFKPLDLAIEALRVVIRSFGKMVLLQSGRLYETLNGHLVEAGVLPKLPSQIRKKASPPEKSRADEATAEGGGDTDGGGDVAEDAAASAGTVEGRDTPASGGSHRRAAGQASAASTVIDIRDILARRNVMGGKPPYAGGSEQAKPLNREELEEALAELQAEAEDFANQRLEKRLQDAVARRFGKDSERRLERDQADAVFLTDELVTTITSDLVLGERGKRWIKMLELPLVRTLLEEKAAVEDPDHPVRKLFNLLGQVHDRPNHALAPKEAKTLERIESVVRELAAGRALDEADLDAATAEIESLIKRQARRRETNTRRVLEACDGQQRLEGARKHVDRLLADRLASEKVAKILVELMESGWRDLMTLSAVREGHESSAVVEAADLMDQLNRRLLDEDADTGEDEYLLKQVRGRLEKSGTEPATQKRVLEQLEQLFDDNAQVETATLPEPEPEPEAHEPEVPDESFWLGRAKLLDVGSWMLYPDETGQVRPLKLAWISENRDKYVFVGRDGHKALEIQPEALSEKLKSQEVDVAGHGDEPLMDRSWQNVVQRMHDQIAHQATHDELTGLLNRKEFERRMRLKVSESKLVDTQHIAMLADLDQFRVINATAGHEAGDRLLLNIADLLRKIMPENSELARLGPDDFAILVPRCDSALGHDLANRIRKAVAEHNTGWLTRKLRVTMSIGVVGINRDSNTIWDVFNRLEVACDAAKEEGDRIRSFELDDTDLTRRNKALEQVQELEKALDAGHLNLHGHMIKALCAPEENGAHFEVLSRIEDSQGNIINPDEFIPAAEAYSRIHLLDLKVIDATLQQLGAVSGAGVAKLSINISGKTFGRPRFTEYLKEKLEEYGVSPSSLCLEITESAAMANLSRCADVLRTVRYMGCSVSLDDFGTGLSSFGYLKHLPVDYLKIDGSFVREIDRSSSDYGLVKTMHETAHLLGKRTIAEFAENDSIIEALREIGIDYIQGYGVEHPRPLLDILKG